MFLMHLWRIWISSHLSCPRASQVIWLIIISSALLSLNCSDSTVACTFLVLSGSDARIICASPLNGTHTLWWVKSGLWTQGACSLSIVVRTWGHVISSSSIIMHPDGRSSSISRSDVLMPSAVYPSLVVGIASAVLVFQLGSEGLTLTSFFLKLLFMCPSCCSVSCWEFSGCWWRKAPWRSVDLTTLGDSHRSSWIYSIS